MKVRVQNKLQNTSIPHSNVQSPSNKNGRFCIWAELELACIFCSNKIQLTKQKNEVLETLFQMQVPNAFFPHYLSRMQTWQLQRTSMLEARAGVWQQNLLEKEVTWQSPGKSSSHALKRSCGENVMELSSLAINYSQ